MRERLLKWLAISERPDPPPGSGPTLDTFRASRNFFRYSVLAWIPKQIFAFAGLLFSLAFFGTINLGFIRAEGWMRFMEKLSGIEFGLMGLDLDASLFVTWFEVLAVIAFVGQLIFSALLLKLSWELRWYMVGEQALRIREGLWSLREQTMTIANIQTMIVRQGPLQRLLGISDLEIHTAGGGASSEGEGGDSGSTTSPLHVGRIRGIEDASGLRDRIAARLKRHRGAGLGDEDDHEVRLEAEAGGSTVEAAGALLDAVRELRHEASRA